MTTRHAALSAIAAVAIATAGAGCGAKHKAASTAPSTSSEPLGRPIGANPGAAQQAAAAATLFVRDYLKVISGRKSARSLTGVDVHLRIALERQRIPPAQRDKRALVQDTHIDRIDPLNARVTVTVSVPAEHLTYPLPVDLERRQGRWIVLSSGADE